MKIQFNEQNAIENMMRLGYIDENNIKKTIYDVAKYNYYVKNMDDKQNYDFVLQYILEHCSGITEAGIYQDIDECIRNCKKHSFRMVDEVCITKSELDFIRNLGDLDQEKASFVMLAVAKYYNVLKENDYDSAFMTHIDICKMARISIASSERDRFMQFAYDKNVLQRHIFADSIVKKLTFVSHDEEDPVVLRLIEGDYLDLAYSYMAYLTPHQYRRCVICKRWFRRSRKRPRVCSECIKKEVRVKKTIQEKICVDCGQVYYAPIQDGVSCRCENCRYEILKEQWRNASNKYHQRLRDTDS